MSDETAQNILNIPLDAYILARKHVWQADWDDYKVGSVKDLQRLAKLWLMKERLLIALNGVKDVGFTTRYGIDLLALLKEIEALGDNNE